MKLDKVKQIRNSYLMIRDLRHCKFYGIKQKQNDDYLFKEESQLLKLTNMV